MLLTCDIHCHSGYSGGVGKISLEKLYENLTKKGINIYGSGDILQPNWRQKLKDILKEKESGLFILKGFENDKRLKYLPRILLETEIVVTAPYYFDRRKRKVAHLLILFPSFEVVEKFAKLFEDIDVKLNIGRPFLRFDSLKELEDFFLELSLKFPDVEFIPAHIFTPDGVLGGENPIDSIENFFGKFTAKINALESGLSADPAMILGIEELNQYAIISNSDAHSEALNRIGREFFAISTTNLSYYDIIESIRNRKIEYSIEFKPEHGRYYLTGHRKDRHENKKEIFFYHNQVPKDFICPICKKKMVEGVEFRVEKLKNFKKEKEEKSKQNYRSQKFFYSIPLIEIIGIALNKSINSKIVYEIYDKILEKIDFESNLYMLNKKEIYEIIDRLDITINVKNAIYRIKNNEFKFEPAGFDGEYGKLKIFY